MDRMKNTDGGAGRVWLISGCSRGLGRTLAEAVLARGDRLVATARDAQSLEPLRQLAPERVQAHALDVNREDRVQAVVAAAIAAFGRIDVLVNNAGYGLAGAVEEVSDAEARAQFETNVFGALSLTRAVLPQMRAQKSGHILQISSASGFVASPGWGCTTPASSPWRAIPRRWRRKWRRWASASPSSSQARSAPTGPAPPC